MKNSSQVESFTSLTGRTAFVTFMAFISLTGALTNVMVILSIFANQTLRTRTNCIVFSLAVSDFFLATVAIPLRLLEEISTSKTTMVPCNIVLAFTVLFDGVSRLNIVLISFDRFMAVRFPFLYEKYASKSAIITVIVSFWAVMGVFAISLLSGAGLANKREQTSKETSKICLLSTTLSEAAVMTFTIGFCLVPILIVVPINCYLLKKSYWHLKKIYDLHKSLHANYNSDGSDNARKQSLDSVFRQRKKAKMVAVLVCLFLILVAPITIIDVIDTLGHSTVPLFLSKTAVCMVYLNVAVNMFVYAAFNMAFREAFHRMLVQCKAFVTR